MSEQPDRLVLFLDRDLGRHVVPAALREQGLADVEIHDDHFAPDAPDPDILAEIGRRGWLFVTKDRRIRYSGLARAATTVSELSGSPCTLLICIGKCEAGSA
jgi:hypothetical protein